MARTPKTNGTPPKKRGRPRKNPEAAFERLATDLRGAPETAPFSFAEPEQTELEQAIEAAPEAIEVEYDDGSIVVDFDAPKVNPAEVTEHTANLADAIPSYDLGIVAEDLLEGIQSDEDSRSEWMATRASGINLLGVKLEHPRSNTASSAPLEGMSVVRDPVLLEAVLRFQANAQGELLPAAGPVKTVDYGGSAESAALADALERDLNYYLTSVASEYYPDSRRMFFGVGFSGMAFRKVYKCPLRRRPVAESVDASDLIVSDTITDLRNAQRITHQITMRQSVMKRMQIIGVYRDVPLTQPTLTQNPIRDKIDQIQGISGSQRPQDTPYTVYECYCELDLPGFEHKDEDGKPTGLPLPYRVTIEKDSRQILEIRRNWKEDDPDQQAKIPFVSYGYAPGLGFYNLGLLHILGNLTNALTAMTREAIDAGMFANFPGFLFAKSGGRQMQNEFRIPPGGGLPIETGDKPIGQVVMPLPYKEAGPGHVALIAQLREVAGRLGGMADIAVGEGRQDAPVGSTVAMIEQATKVEGAVHKALHAAQAEEFRLLCELFREDPEALWRGNRRPALGVGDERTARFIAALDNSDIVPASDPNVPSHVHRIMKATAIRQLASANPQLYNQVAVDSRVLSMLNVDRPEDLFMPPQQPQIDPVVQAQMAAEQKKAEQKDKEIELKALQIKVDADSDQKDREARQNIEVLKVAASLAANPASDAVVDEQLAQMGNMLTPLRSSPPSEGPVRPSAPNRSSDLPPLRPPRSSPSPLPPGLGGLMGLVPRGQQQFSLNGAFR